MIPDGLYDNTANYRREYYEDGKVFSFLGANYLWQKGPSIFWFNKNWFAPWLSYPDLPKGEFNDKT